LSPSLLNLGGWLKAVFWYFEGKLSLSCSFYFDISMRSNLANLL
jgi:hypothetical protein